jgi:hypothetical protein
MILKVNELRIGNYLNYTVNGDKLHLGKVTLLNSTDGVGTIDYHYPISFAQPIPLTEQWLESFGFVNKILKAEHNDIIWYDDHIGIKGMLGIIKPKEIKHVHQLQNLYFAITGKELDKK